MSLDEQISLLRQELKVWEKSFAAQNGGRKAGREDIKRDPAIGSIYLTYLESRSCPLTLFSCKVQRLRPASKAETDSPSKPEQKDELCAAHFESIKATP